MMLKHRAQACPEHRAHAYATDGRTDGLTQTTKVNLSSHETLRAREANEMSMTKSQFQRLGEALYGDQVVRGPVVRTGERPPISKLLRQMVYRRDQWTCQACHKTPWAREPSRRSGPLHLDHIVPWSAGGQDVSTNLRTLCGECNTDRSNFVSSSDRLMTPCVRICAPCLAGVDERVSRWCENPGEKIVVFCGCHSHMSWALKGWSIL